MARIKRSVNALKKRRKVMKLAKGYWGAKSKQYRAASEQVARSLRYAFKGRKLRKRDFRSLWITRINAAARLNGMSYSTFINGLKKHNITVNRKILADLAVNDAAAFTKLVEIAKASLSPKRFIAQIRPMLKPCFSAGRFFALFSGQGTHKFNGRIGFFCPDWSSAHELILFPDSTAPSACAFFVLASAHSI